MLDLTLQKSLFLGLWILLVPSEHTVGRKPEPSPDVFKVTVKEGEDAILPCSISTHENIVQKLFDWKKGHQEVFLYDAGLHYNNGRSGQDEEFKGRVSHFQEELKFGNASIIISKTKMTDGGNYTCHFPRLQPNEVFYIHLVVDLLHKDRSVEISGAPSNPFVTIADVTEGRVVLQCGVQFVFPKPTLQWRDSEGNILPSEEPQISERGGRYDVMLQTTVEKTNTNRFYCEVKQKEIGHVVKESITVPEKLFGDNSNQVVHAWIGGWFLGFLSFAVVEAVILFAARKHIKKVWMKGLEQEKSFSSNEPTQPLNFQV